MIRKLENETFRQLCERANFWRVENYDCYLDKEAIAKFCGVSVSTVERWLYTNKPHPSAKALVISRVLGTGCHDAFSGFYFCKDGKLWTPDGANSFSASYLKGLWIREQSYRFAQQRCDQLSKEVSHLRNLVHARERLKDIGQEIIDISSDLEFMERLAKKNTDLSQELTKQA